MNQLVRFNNFLNFLLAILAAKVTKMNKLSVFLLSGFLMLGAAACDNARTSSEAPSTTQSGQNAVDKQEASETQSDAVSDIRRNQANADIRAREQRNDMVNDGSAENRDDDDLTSEVRSKLEANLPASALVVDTEDGIVTISGTVPTQEQYDRIAVLAKEIKGVRSLDIKAKVAPAQTNQS
jgi:hyperosmotically inducible periplasmic protein